jgi:hypothetical protein
LYESQGDPKRVFEERTKSITPVASAVSERFGNEYFEAVRDGKAFVEMFGDAELASSV